MAVVAVRLLERFCRGRIADQPEGLGRLSAHARIRVCAQHDHEWADGARIGEAAQCCGCLEAHVAFRVVEGAN